jgi:WD40 repeat protein
MSVPSESATLPPSPPVSSAAATEPIEVAGYEVLRELGRGGMGVVYQARQTKLGRVVALKMILSGAHAGEGDTARFRTEAEAIARLQHPNIVQIYEVGEHGGLPFFSLEFCPGGGLDRKLNGTPLPAKEAASLVEVLARAMHAAHQKGVVHRDLKPANVLLAEDGTLKITDFGLAKKLDEAGQTASGAVMGTPSYMAPEQAGYQPDAPARAIGPAADVYALGAILYECLTGRPPFKAATPLDTILQVVADDPVPPTRLQPTVPRDLETICLKCLEKAPAKRYGSAQELADDLRRFLDGRPVAARRSGLVERAGKWARRRPAVAALLAALAVVVAGGLVGMTVLYLKAVEERGSAEWERDRAREARTAADESRGQAERRYDESRRRLYASQITLAQLALRDGNLALARELLGGLVPREGESDLRGFEWHYLWRQSDVVTPLGPDAPAAPPEGFDGASRLFLYAPPDGGRLLLHDRRQQTLTEWDLKTRQRTGPRKGAGEALSPDGKLAATVLYEFKGRDHREVTGVRVRDMDTGRETTLPGVPGVAAPFGDWNLTFSPDGRRLALGWTTDGGGGSAAVWDVTGRRLVASLKNDPVGGSTALAFSPDGQYLAGGGGDPSRVTVWEIASGTRSRLLQTNDSPVRRLCYTADGRRIVVACGYGDLTRIIIKPEVKILECETGKELLRLRERWPADAIAVSHDGRLLVTAWAAGFEMNELVARDAAGGDEVFRWRYRGAPVADLAFTPDGARLAVLDGTGRVSLLDVARWQPARPLWGGESAPLYGVAFSPDGRQVASWGQGQEVYLADAVAAVPAPPFVRAQAAQVNGAAYHPGGRVLASAGSDGTVGLWDANHCSALLCLEECAPNPGVRCVAFSPKGDQLAFATSRPEVRVIDPATRAEVFRAGGAAADVRALAYSADGALLAGAGERVVRLWDAATGRETASFPMPAAVKAVAFSRQGVRLAAGLADGTLLTWDTGGGETVTLRGHNGAANCVAFSPGGERIASAGEDGTVKLWDPTIAQELCTLRGHTGGVTGVSFSPDGRRLASAGRDGMLRLWEGAPAEAGGPPGELPAWLTPEVVADARRRRATRDHLRRIVLAFHKYADEHGRLPPAVTTGPKGEPLYSWRVALLPYLGHKDLYDQFKHDEPWDGPHNSKLLDRMPDVYAHDPERKGSTTPFQVFVGPDAPFAPGRPPPSASSFTDGTSNTILVAEGGKGVPWTKPDDLPFDPKKPLPALGGAFADGFYVGMADGSVRFVRKSVSEKTIRAAITPNGGEVIGPDWYRGD